MAKKSRKPIKPLEQFQRKRRRAFNSVPTFCKCGEAMRAYSTQGSVTYFKCRECGSTAKKSHGMR